MFSLFSRSTLYATLALTAFACNQQPDNETDKELHQTDHRPDQSGKTPVSTPPTQTPADTNLETQNDRAEPLAGSVGTADNANTDSAADVLDAPSPSENYQPNDKENIVADIGFSGSSELPVEPEPQLFCINQPNKSEYSVEQACKAISSRLASVSMRSCESATLEPTGCESAKGFPILTREFAPIDNVQPRGRILIIGGTHGDELTSVSVTFRWIEKLNKHHSGLFHWHITPLMNPDGVLKKSASRTNSNGVDLNRNLPSDDWGRNALSYWKNRGGKDPRKYPGEQAASEPETKWLIDEINTFKPDAIISVHAPYGVVDFDALRLNTAPRSLGKLHLNLLGTYPGSLGNYAGINRNIPVITLELPHSWVMPSDQETTRIWEDIVTWLKKNIDTTKKSEQTSSNS